MPWMPPESLEEKAKRLLVPPRLYIRNRYLRELRKGERELHLVPLLARRDRISLDVGANKGVYAYALLEHSSAVHAFEPNPKLYRILESWARGRATLHPIALGDRPGTATLMIPKSGRGYSNQGGSLSTVKIGGGAYGEVTVECRRIDDMEISGIGFIKIDVEGFESQVIRGAAETLRRDRPNLLIEIEEKHTRRPLPEIIGEICEHGYRCLALQQGTLTAFERIDLDRFHRAPQTRSDYIFNFVFLPA